MDVAVADDEGENNSLARIGATENQPVHGRDGKAEGQKHELILPESKPKEEILGRRDRLRLGSHLWSLMLAAPRLSMVQAKGLLHQGYAAVE